MKRLSFISDAPNASHDIRKELAAIFAVREMFAEDIGRTDPDPFVFVNIAPDRLVHADHFKRWLRRRPRDGAAVFAVDLRSRLQIVRAYSLGATDVISRPVLGQELLRTLLQGNSSATSAPSKNRDNIVKCANALQGLFLSASAGTPLDTQAIAEAGRVIIGHIEEYGFAEWVRAVRAHHDPTYRHCLIVAGTAAAFAAQMEFNRTDLSRVAVAGLLHDVGKAQIPIAILEKPAALDLAERAEVQRHVILGYDSLRTAPELHPEMLDVVLHHHEYLDGSGYPHGLQGPEISDLTRIVTIADIFSALIERRAYRGPMSGTDAYQILLDAGNKLDRDLVRAFKPLSCVQFV